MHVLILLAKVGRDMSRRIKSKTSLYNISTDFQTQEWRRHKCRPTGAILLLLLSTGVFATEPLKIDGSTGVKPLMQALVTGYEAQAGRTVAQFGEGLKPQARINALLNKDIDIAMASHGIDAQKITAKGLRVYRFARMAVVLAVNHSVAINNLSQTQVCDIYSSVRRNWRDFSAADQLISPFIRPFSEVDSEVLRDQMECFDESIISSEIEVINKSGAMARRIAKTPGAIGMTTLVRVAQSKGKMRAVAINNVKPNTENMLSGAYPYGRDSFLIVHQESTKSVQELLHFIQSNQGAAIIVANNAVPVL